ncbi:hypothetical protein Dsin_018238 [Dipteronia sinensis]|uniref:Uncharacterized protein n=1 Tax=Dipteronia sinensis TaxID=43782 RepID=A0AAE0E1G1_9ROSI|nr:hypothetical protein Dsin_018238 [Dipteronia sinensis]
MEVYSRPPYVEIHVSSDVSGRHRDPMCLRRKEPLLHLKPTEGAAIRRSTAACLCIVAPSGAETGLHLTPAVERRSNSRRRWGGWPPQAAR